MNAPDGIYGELIRLDPVGSSQSQTLKRVPLGTSATSGGLDEARLRDLLFLHPQSLPITAIDPAYGGAVAVCKELSTPAGYVDALYANPDGRLILAEFKLWRNPQARREVIGQILDYTQELASWGYEDLQREVSRRLGKHGNVLYDLVREVAPETDEAAFVDNVERYLGRGEFLLLIIGDGIREGVGKIVDFVQRHSGLHFQLALVEAALYRDSEDQILVQPRVLARTEIVQRIVVEGGVPIDAPEEEEQDDVHSDLERENLRFWSEVTDDLHFSDVTIEKPPATKGSWINIPVNKSAVGGYALFFGAYLERHTSLIGCYLGCRKGLLRENRIHDRLRASIEELQIEAGDDLLAWTNRDGRPRIGFQRKTSLPFPPDGDDSSEFDEAVEWMRDRLDRLVSTLNPRLQRILSEGD